MTPEAAATERPIRLMIPGPVTLSAACAAELCRPLEPHFGPAWAQIHRETVELLGQAFGTEEADVYPLVGSGSSGLDAAIGNIVSAGERVVVGVNGFFGARLAAISRGHGAEVVEVPATWGEPLDPDAIAAALSADPRVAAVLVTHVETSTGVRNPIEDIAAIDRMGDTCLLVDAVSSAGALDIAMDERGIDVCVTASQKCLGAAAGLAPVAVGPRAWDAVERRRSPRGWYQDLQTWRDHAEQHADWHPTPVTMPTPVMRTLRQGLRELLAEGMARRSERLERLAARLRAGVRELGLVPVADDRWASPVVTAVRAPDGISSAEIVRFVEASHGIRIAGGGFGPLGDRVFRIGHMAPSTTEQDIDDVVAAVEAFLRARSRSGARSSAAVR